MRSYGEHPAVVLGSTLIGLMVGVFLLFVMMGGGFLLALLVLALTPLAAGAMVVASALQQRAARKAVERAMAPAPRPILASAPTEQRIPVLAMRTSNRDLSGSGTAPTGRAETEERRVPIDGENPAVLVASLLAGTFVAGFLVLAMTGGGYLLAALFLAVTLMGAGAAGLARVMRRQAVAQAAEAIPAAPAIAAPARGRLVAWGLVGAAALAVFSLGTMTLTHDWTHTAEDIRSDWLLYLPALLGFGALVSLLVMAPSKPALVWGSSLLAIAGTGIATAALMGCCVGTLAAAWGSPALTSLAVTLLVYKAPIAVAGVTANILGLIPLARVPARPGAASA